MPSPFDPLAPKPPLPTDPAERAWVEHVRREAEVVHLTTLAGMELADWQFLIELRQPEWPDMDATGIEGQVRWMKLRAKLWETEPEGLTNEDYRSQALNHLIPKYPELNWTLVGEWLANREEPHVPHPVKGERWPTMEEELRLHARINADLLAHADGADQLPIGMLVMVAEEDGIEDAEELVAAESAIPFTRANIDSMKSRQGDYLREAEAVARSERLMDPWAEEPELYRALVKVAGIYEAGIATLEGRPVPIAPKPLDVSTAVDPLPALTTGGDERKEGAVTVEAEPSETEWLTAREAASVLGMAYSTMTIELAGGRFPFARKIAGKWLIPKKPFMEWFHGDRADMPVAPKTRKAVASPIERRRPDGRAIKF